MPSNCLRRPRAHPRPPTRSATSRCTAATSTSSIRCPRLPPLRCGSPAPATLLQPLSRERGMDYYGLYNDHGPPYGYPAVCEEDLMPEDDQRATRNLFIGNWDHSMSEVEL